jgi:hypothetical protein
MQWMRIPSRHVCRLTLSVCVLFGVCSVCDLSKEDRRPRLAYAAELKVPEEAPVERFDFEQQGIEGWKPVAGRWAIEEMLGAPSAGREDASGGIVFRFAEGHYYVVRANALENNFRLYYYDRGRHQLATASAQPPALGQWHTLRVVALGDHIQAYLNGALLLEHRDSRYRTGQVGLWTKADSVTAFDDFVVRGIHAGR